MAVLDIRKYGEPVLKKRAKEVKEIDGEIEKLANDMLETMAVAKGIGLAAPQVGVSKRVMVVQIEQGSRVFVNPEIINKSREAVIEDEGCLSLPGFWLKIKRAKEVEIEALDIGRKPVKIKAEGLLARAIQHEIDHLDGILIIDKIPFWQRLKLKKQLKDYVFD